MKFSDKWFDKWQTLAARERRLILGATAFVGAVLVWFLLLAPALKILSTADSQIRVLDKQLQQMQIMQQQAQAIQQRPPLAYDEAVRALTAATTQTLGSAAQISVQGEKAAITLQAVPADALARWLEQMRLNARSTPIEAHLTRVSTAAGAAWSGTLAMRLPQQ
jgi:general secretion pathway protein M